MLKFVKKNKFICKQVGLEFCLKFNEFSKAQNLSILNNRYFQKMYAQKGNEFM
jgi:hypothetical protein